VAKRTNTVVNAGHGLARGGNFKSGVSTLKHASFPAAEIAAATKISSNSAPKGIFAAFLEALHYSRRIQARRVLHQYGHLISATESDDAPAPSTD